MTTEDGCRERKDYIMEELLTKLAEAAKARKEAATQLAVAEEEFQLALKAYSEYKKNNGSDDPGA